MKIFDVVASQHVLVPARGEDLEYRVDYLGATGSDEVRVRCWQLLPFELRVPESVPAPDESRVCHASMLAADDFPLSRDRVFHSLQDAMGAVLKALRDQSGDADG